MTGKIFQNFGITLVLTGASIASASRSTVIHNAKPYMTTVLIVTILLSVWVGLTPA
jgi:hypothetical protein